MQKITLIQPDDWHCHLRDGIFLNRTVNDMARCYRRAIVMPNLKPPVATVEQASAYRKRIFEHLNAEANFEPLMTIYLTDSTSADDIKKITQHDWMIGAKLYPAGVTTNSSAGVKDIESIFPVFEAMQQHDVPLLIHGETANPNIDRFDREAYFIDNELRSIVKHFPELRIVFEHLTSAYGVACVRESSQYMAATITPQHLLYSRDELFKEGVLQPHQFCLPIHKSSNDQQALVKAATSGNAKFFLGTDSAPHAKHKKESTDCCAGVYSANASIEWYAEIFAAENALGKLETFASINGPNFYKRPINEGTITLVKKSWHIPATLEYGDDLLVPLGADTNAQWQLV